LGWAGDGLPDVGAERVTQCRRSSPVRGAGGARWPRTRLSSGVRHQLLLTIFALVIPVRVLRAGDPFGRCLSALRDTRAARGIADSTWRHLAEVRPDTAVLRQLNAQPEFRLPIWDYVAVMADQERVDDGVRLMKEQGAIFEAVEKRFGVDAAAVAAVWGIESNFGRGVGTFSVLRSLATLGCVGRRQLYFRGELLSALRIVQGGHIAPDRFLGSWAGAFGQTQFMPGVFWGRAVDFDGDGRKDLMNNVGDALASTANYLRLAGWKRGMPWGFEVRLPAVDVGRGGGRRLRRPLYEWAVRGIRRVDGTPLYPAGSADSGLLAGVLAPTGGAGPAFLVTANFEAIFRYNAAESYALAIAHLADRLRGSGPIVTPWPTDDPGLSRADRRELQALLLARGHRIGTPDGLLTPMVREAVRAEQVRLGHPGTGRPGQRLLTALRTP
jgi:lytic murein transglycosylase